MNEASLSNQQTSGIIGETRVADVLRDLEAEARDARIWFETEYGVGEVLFHKGKMIQARLGGARGQTALLRLLTISEGRYGIESRVVADGAVLIEDVNRLVELHKSRQAEWVELCSHAPPLSSVLRLTASGADVRDSSRGIQRVVFVLIDGRRTLMQVLDESSFDPVEALRIITKSVDEGLVQHAPQPNTLFPLASTGDASGVLPRFATPAPLPRIDPSSPGLAAGPASWRHSTLVGLGKNAAIVGESRRIVAPSPIIDLGRNTPGSLGVDAGRTHEVHSLVKTVITGFGLGRKASAARARALAEQESGGGNADVVGVNQDDGSDQSFEREVTSRKPIIDVSSDPDLATEYQSYEGAGPPSEEFMAAAAVPNLSRNRRFIDRYEILLRIGRGGMGTVYLCRLSSANVGFRRLYALKLLRSHLSRDTQAAKDFLEEARVAGYLHHANVVAVCDAGFNGPQPYLVMEYVEGCSFKQLMRSLPSRSPYLLLPVFIDALAGLHAAHILQDEAGADLKLVHCDVSPENMLVGVDGICRLTDFGIARRANKALGTTTRGKPGYVAPEQIAGQTFDHRADIFSMGVVLWGALTGQRLFSGKTVEEALLQVCNKPIPPPSAAGAQSYPALDEVILRALSRDPNDRFDTAEEMMTALGRIALAHDGLASTKEIATWVREAAGSELTQRRLAILDASQNTDSILPEGDATTEVAPPQAEAGDPTHIVMTSELLSPAESNVPSRRAIVSEDVDTHSELKSEDVQSTHQEESPLVPSVGPSSVDDVSSLFYGKDGLAFRAPRSLSPVGVRSVSESKTGRTRQRLPSRMGWLLLTVVVVAVGLVVFFVMRSKSQSPARSSLNDAQFDAGSSAERRIPERTL